MEARGIAPTKTPIGPPQESAVSHQHRHKPSGSVVLNNGKDMNRLLLYRLNENYNLVDSLPYVDGFSDDLKDELRNLISAEAAQMPEKDYLAPLGPSKTPLLDAIVNSGSSTNSNKLECEFSWQSSIDLIKRRANRSSTEESTPATDSGISGNRKLAEGADNPSFEIPQICPPAEAEAGDINAWKTALAKARAQTEHTRVQILNLELALKFAQPAWAKHLLDLEAHGKILTKRSAALVRDIEEVNKRRKLVQIAGGNDFRVLSREYDDMVNRNLTILKALNEMQN